MLFLAACATTAEEIRNMGADDTLYVNRPYDTVSKCAAQEIIDKHNAAVSVQKVNNGNSTMIVRDIPGGGYFVQIDRLPNGTAKVSTYLSNNIIFDKNMSSELMAIIKQYCT